MSSNFSPFVSATDVIVFLYRYLIFSVTKLSLTWVVVDVISYRVPLFRRPEEEAK